MSLRFHSSSWFGEIALLGDGNRTLDGHASMNTKTAILPKQGVMQACQNPPMFIKRLWHCCACIADKLLQRMAINNSREIHFIVT
jgi:hypothetical protein